MKTLQILPDRELSQLAAPPIAARPPEGQSQISTLNSQILRPRRPARELKFGTITIPYQQYRTGTGREYYLLYWYHAGRRIRECRTTFAALKKRGESIAQAIERGQAAMNSFSEADRAAYLRSLEIAAPTGKPLELLTSLAAECLEILDNRISPAEACRDWVARHRAKLEPRTVPQLIVELLDDRRQYGAGTRWLDCLESQLNRFAEWWTGPLDLLRGPEVNAWLRTLKDKDGHAAGPRTRANYRAALVQLASFAQANGYLPKDWAELDQVPATRHAHAEIRTLTPEQLVALLARSPESLVPFVACAAFAGLRHEELAPPGDGPRLDWRDVDLARRNIYVPSDVGKEGDRNVPVADNLAAWLAPYRKPSGPVCRLANAASALNRAKVKAGIPAERNATRNTLRKSFISYRLAIVKHIGQVAEEAGNSPTIIKRHYKRALPEDQARRWFGLWPTTAEILQLNLAGL